MLFLPWEKLKIESSCDFYSVFGSDFSHPIWYDLAVVDRLFINDAIPFDWFWNHFFTVINWMHIEQYSWFNVQRKPEPLYFNLKCNLWTNPLSLESLQRSLLIHFETFSILCHTVTPFSQYIQFKFRQVVNFLQQFENGTLIIIILYLMVYL